MNIFLIAGEASGDRLGAALMAGLRRAAPEVQFYGVGGPAMQAEGLQSLFPMEDLSVMGLAEVLPKYRHLRRRLHETAEAALKVRPDALIGIDSPDFCLRVARLVRAQRPDQRVMHYVAPSVWAWRPARAQKMAQVVDHVLALLPFEPAYMEAAGMTCDFVGHPVVSEPRATAQEAAAFRRDLGADGPLVMVLPGSRRGEVSRLAPRLGGALRLIAGAHPDAQFIVPRVRGTADLVAELSRDWPRPLHLLDPQDAGEKRAAFAAADVAIAASGTVSLELAANAVPMVIAYDFNWLSRAILQRMVRLDTVTLVNLVSETRAVPEFLGKNCRPEPIAAAALRLIAGGPERAAQLKAMAVTMERLGAGGDPPGDRAARSVLGALD
ncbi:lipid-A-disaccharide synthase [Halodurantibacterium flavum]|uniref:Lipid-A-disaccharide synthase n=1 Tax=Halodurantibacterium flavum TaxID=1382802 RepID=A0ABW4S9Z3_9RHOB